MPDAMLDGMGTEMNSRASPSPQGAHHLVHKTHGVCVWWATAQCESPKTVVCSGHTWESVLCLLGAQGR